MNLIDLSNEYKTLYNKILQEHLLVFQQQNVDEIQELMSEIIVSKRIFVMGVGREGIAARGFAMRLMHLGKDVHWIWDDTTPGMSDGDLFIAVNGSGQIGHIHYVVQQAKTTGAKTVVITGAPNQKTPMIADSSVFVPAEVYNGTDSRCVESIQPMGNLFEQHLFMLFDIIVILMEKELGLSHAQMEKRHRNVE